MDFDDFYTNRRNSDLWAYWRSYSRYCFGTGKSHIPPHITNIISFSDEDRNAFNAQAKTIKIPIEITTDSNGEPQVPLITGANGNNIRFIQTALRKYCTDHIRE